MPSCCSMLGSSNWLGCLFFSKSISGVAIESLDASDMDQLEAIDKDKFWVGPFLD